MNMNTNTTTIDHFEIDAQNLKTVKQFFQVSSDQEALRKAVEMTVGKIQLEMVFEKFKGTSFNKVYD